MWRRRPTPQPGDDVNMNNGDIVSLEDARAMQVHDGQNNQLAHAADIRLSPAWQAAAHAKAYVDARINAATGESRMHTEALSRAIADVHNNQAALQDNFGAIFRSIETSALDHIAAVSQDVLSQHYAALQVFNEHMQDFDQRSTLRESKLAAAMSANENGIATCQRALNTRMDDLEATTKREVQAIHRDVIAVVPQDLVDRIVQLEAQADQLPCRVSLLEGSVDDLVVSAKEQPIQDAIQRVADLEARLQDLPRRVSKLEQLVEHLPDRVQQLEERVENIRASERRTSERLDSLTAASKHAIDSAMARLSGRIDRSEARSRTVSLAPIEDAKSQLGQRIDGVATTAKSMLDDTDARLASTTALAACLHSKVNCHDTALSQLQARMSHSAPALNNHVQTQVVALGTAQEQHGQVIAALGGAFDQQTQELTALRAFGDQQAQAIRGLLEKQEHQSSMLQVNTASTSHVAQAFEALRLWVEAKASQQEQHCRAIRETNADLEQSIDERMAAWIRRETVILAMRDRANSIASDGTASSDNFSELNFLAETQAASPPTVPHPTVPDRDPNALDARLEAEIRYRAALYESDRIHAAAVRQRTQRVEIEREVQRLRDLESAHTGHVTSRDYRNTESHDEPVTLSAEEELQFERAMRVESERRGSARDLQTQEHRGLQGERARGVAAIARVEARAAQPERTVPAAQPERTVPAAQSERAVSSAHRPSGRRPEPSASSTSSSQTPWQSPRNDGGAWRRRATSRRQEATGVTRRMNGRSEDRQRARVDDQERLTPPDISPSPNRGSLRGRGRGQWRNRGRSGTVNLTVEPSSGQSLLEIARADAQARVQQQAARRADALRR